MEAANQGSSIYHQIHAVYARSLDGTLLHITGRHEKETTEAWSGIMAEVERRHNKPLQHHLGRQERATPIATMWEPLPNLSSTVESWSIGKKTSISSDSENPKPTHGTLGIRELQRPGE